MHAHTSSACPRQLTTSAPSVPSPPHRHECVRREHAKDEKWSSWVRAIFKLCCDPSDSAVAPVEATSAMMMAIEQFVIGHHQGVRACVAGGLLPTSDCNHVASGPRLVFVHHTCRCMRQL